MARKVVPTFLKAILTLLWARPEGRRRLKAKFGVSSLQELFEYIVENWDKIKPIIEDIMKIVVQLISMF